MRGHPKPKSYPVAGEWEPMGPSPFPSIVSLRDWDFTVLDRYRPFYMPFCDMCCLCTFGKCDLTGGKRGACGIDIGTQQSRMIALITSIGAATHTSHARYLLEHLIKKYGPDHPINLGTEINVKAPLTRLIAGLRPTKLSDLKQVLDYIENQLTHLLATIHTGQEGSSLDFESKALHAGMLDNLALEIADIAQISAYNFPKADPNAPLVEIGFGTIDITKPVILCIGHNVAAGVEIVDYLREKGLEDKVEVCGICCTAHDVTRYFEKAKIVGPISRQVKFVRSGVADVIVLDEQCIRTDLLIEAKKVKTPVIVVTDKVCHGLKNRTDDSPLAIVEDFVERRADGALILDPFKAAEVAVQTAIRLAPLRQKFKIIPKKEEIAEIAKKCTRCKLCDRSCPVDLPINEAILLAAKGDLTKLSDLYDLCVGCIKCEQACRADIPILSLMEEAAEARIKQERYKIRAGRGPIQDVEIRKVGAPIVLGEIPGIIAFVGCANYPRGPRELVDMCGEFLKRRYIVVTSGCSAMDIAMWKDEEGLSPYERYPGDFDAGCLANTGSCVSNSHIIGATIKIANIFARRPLRANYEEIADYVLNRVGAVAIAWGAMSQKALAIATGANRLGIPVIVGPQGSKYRRLYLGRSDNREDWIVYDARTGNKVYVGPTPEHLFYVTESKEEAIVMATKLCMRPNDTTRGRAVKLTHYIDLHQRFYGKLPDDLHLLIRSEFDIPITMKYELLEYLKEKKWEPMPHLDPTLLPRLVRVRK